jgi:hypothetical protein
MSEATYRDAVTVEWGDCDEAGIVFYPNYFFGSTVASSVSSEAAVSVNGFYGRGSER